MLSLTVAATLLAGAAYAQSPFIDQKGLTSAAAEKIGKTCLALSASKNIKAAVVVLDIYGHELYVSRADGASDIVLDTARRKAQTAYTFRRATSVLAEGVRNGGVNVAQWIGEFPVLGGLPIIVNGEIAGAVGVGGGPPPHDEQCGLAGLDAVGAPKPVIAGATPAR